MNNSNFLSNNFLRYSSEKIVRSGHHCDYIREIALLAVNQEFNKENIKVILSKYNISSTKDIKSEILEMLIDYAIIVFDNDKIAENGKSNFNLLKDNLEVQVGDFYYYTPIHVTIILQNLFKKICWITNLKDELEARFDTDMQTFFKLSKEQLNQLKNSNISEFWGKLNNLKQKDMVGISDIALLGNLMLKILPWEGKRIKDIADSLMAKWLCKETDVTKVNIMSKIREVYGYNEKKIQDNNVYQKIVSTLIVRYNENPPNHMQRDTVSKIIEKLIELLSENTDNKEEIIPNPVIKNIEEGTKTEREKKDNQPTKTNYDCLLQLYNELESDKSYTFEEIKKGFESILTKNGLTPSNNTIDTYIRFSIVNFTSRHHYNIKSPDEKRLFYYPDEKTKVLKKFSLDIKDNPTIYWTGDDKKRKEMKLSEVLKMKK